MQCLRTKSNLRALAVVGIVGMFGSIASGQVIISEVVDGTLTGGQPKWVEITNVGCEDADLSGYSFGNFSNGGTTLGGGSAAVLAGTLAPGDSYVIGYDSDDIPFFDVYGFSPDFLMGGGFVNGDDTLALFEGAATGDGSDATLVDLYGRIGEDGTGLAWEYTDSYAFRNPDVLAGNTSFDEAEWTIAGANALEDPGGDDAIETQNLLDNTTPLTHAHDTPNCSGGPGELLISEVVDGTLTGGQPKWVEITNVGCDDIDLSAYSFGNFSNGSTTLGGGSAAILVGTLAAGESYVIGYDSDDIPFFDVYGFSPDFLMGGGFINGDDTLALFLGAATGDGTDATLVDLYGRIGEDGTGLAWEYTDSYAFRNANILSGNIVFDEGEWTIAGANALEDPGGDDAIETQNLLDNTTPGAHAHDDNCGGGGDPVLVINEIIQNPSAVSDTNGEWLELYNPTNFAIDIDQWVLSDNDSDSIVIDALNGNTVVPAGGYLVLGRNGDFGTNGGVIVDNVYSSFFLSNGGDEVVLTTDGGLEVDRVEYDGGPAFPDPNGASMSLIDPALDNNVGANWCTASTPYGDGDLGTPGAANVCAFGACCDTIMLICSDNVVSDQCPGPDFEFTADTLCDELDPPCEIPITGACCDLDTFTCTDGVEKPDCAGQNQQFSKDTLCDDLNPPCVPPVIGACCFAGYCTENVEEGYCNDNGGSFQGDGSGCGGVDCGDPTVAVINEIRIDQIGGDNDEYFELFGAPNTSLDGLWYVVIGDSTDNISGNIESITSLAGSSIDANGYFVAAEDTFTAGIADLVTDINFENSDNVTHLLVAGFTGEQNLDLDVDRDCALDFTPWAGELDRIALVEEDNPATGTECHYGPPSVGPDGTFVPGHVFRCANGTGDFVIGSFDPVGDTDTPGEANLCPMGACCDNAGGCSILGQTDCEAAGGSYLGDDTLCEGDTDADGVDGECGDNCPDDPDKTEPGLCGCGVSDVDNDDDGTPDCNDGCPFDPFKTDPGICGCGFADVDSDNDGFLDCQETCDFDPDKQEPGVCGCGNPDIDSDNDGVLDCNDVCPGLDDTIDVDNDGNPDCTKTNNVPAVSTWGLAVLTLLLLVGAKLTQRKRAFATV